jgi:hypothetical protein
MKIGNAREMGRKLRKKYSKRRLSKKNRIVAIL